MIHFQIFLHLVGGLASRRGAEIDYLNRRAEDWAAVNKVGYFFSS